MIPEDTYALPKNGKLHENTSQRPPTYSVAEDKIR
jgi:hypothetical protein